jgi:hypothetical protein
MPFPAKELHRGGLTVLAWPERWRVFAARNERECQTSCLLCSELGVPLALCAVGAPHTTCLGRHAASAESGGVSIRVQAAAVGAPAHGMVN